MIRASAFALAAVVYAAFSTAFAQDMNGQWNAVIEISGFGSQHDPAYPDYFSAALTEEDGRVFGEGVINRCAACASFDDFAVNWEGVREGNFVRLRGTYPRRTFETPLIFTGYISADGERVEGELTDERRQFREKWTMQRAQRQQGD